jgi:formylglycine-generating enzyme required for sulfatase activity
MAIAMTCSTAEGDPAADYETLFGDEARKVAASGSKSDDAAFAAKLVALAKDMTDAPAAQVYFCEKAVEFGAAGSAGYKTALDAIAFLQKAAPKRKALWLDKKLKIAKLQYTKTYGVMKKAAAPAYMEALEAVADAKVIDCKASEAKLLYDRAIIVATYLGSDRIASIRDKKKRVDAIVGQELQFKSLHAKLAKDPKDSATREQLVILHIVARDAPLQAAKLLSDDLDEALRTYVALAAKGLDTLNETACMDMGNWYSKTLYAKAAGKSVVLVRAKGYYERFLSLHTKSDVQAIRVKMSLRKIDAELKKLGTPVVSRPKTLTRSRTLDLGKGVKMKFVLIAAGKFQMGSPKSTRHSTYGETPQHEVTISKPFYMGVTEVTQEQYETLTGSNPGRYKDPKNPVESISWKDAVAFCEALSKKTRAQVYLPTEAQWEYACRAGSTTAYSFGDSLEKLGDYAWFRDTSDRTTHPVAKKKPNAFGLYDMHGNVWEWCSDVFSTSFYTEAKVVDPENRPRTTSTYISRSLRGGCFRDSSSYIGSAKRRGYSSSSKSYRHGFRVVILTAPRKGVLTPAQAAARLVGRIGIGGIKGTEISYKDPTVTQSGRTLFGGSSSELNRMGKRKEPGSNVEYSIFGSTMWSDYTLRFKAMKKRGPDGFFVRFADNGRGDYYVWNIGGKGNRRFSIERVSGGKTRRILKTISGRVSTNRLYAIQVELDGSTVSCSLDNRLIFKLDMSKIPK